MVEGGPISHEHVVIFEAERADQITLKRLANFNDDEKGVIMV